MEEYSTLSSEDKALLKRKIKSELSFLLIPILLASLFYIFILIGTEKFVVILIITSLYALTVLVFSNIFLPKTYQSYLALRENKKELIKTTVLDKRSNVNTTYETDILVNRGYKIQLKEFFIDIEGQTIMLTEDQFKKIKIGNTITIERIPTTKTILNIYV